MVRQAGLKNSTYFTLQIVFTRNWDERGCNWPLETWPARGSPHQLSGVIVVYCLTAAWVRPVKVEPRTTRLSCITLVYCPVVRLPLQQRNEHILVVTKDTPIMTTRNHHKLTWVIQPE
ncbi:hypothetical protein ACJJTC_007130 [Scirpophaga incertulas]